MALAAKIDTNKVKRFYLIRSINQPRVMIPKPYRMVGGVSNQTGTDLETAVYQAYSLIGRANGVQNQALRRFYDKVGNSNALTVSIIQRQQSLDMAASIIKNVLDVALALKRRDPSILNRIRRHYRRNNRFQIAKDFSGLWLQYWFGIKPLISDVHAVLGIFSDELPVETAVGTASGVVKYDTSSLDYNGYYEGNYYSGKVTCRIASVISVGDPNLNLFSRVGVDQPFGTAWEIIPFSFMVDYVFNIGECLSNLEPKYPGLDFLQPCTTFSYKGSYAHMYWESEGDYFHIPYKRRPLRKIRDSGQIYGMDRAISIPRFKFENRLPVLNGQKLSYVCAVFLQLFAHKAR